MSTEVTKAKAFKDLVVEAEGLGLPPTQLLDLYNWVDPPEKAELLAMLEARDIAGKWSIFHALKKRSSVAGLVPDEPVYKVVLWHIEASIEAAYAITNDTDELRALEKQCDRAFPVMGKIKEKVLSEYRKQVPTAAVERLLEINNEAHARHDQELMVSAQLRLREFAQSLETESKDPAELVRAIDWPIDSDTRSSLHSAAVELTEVDKDLHKLRMHPLVRLDDCLRALSKLAEVTTSDTMLWLVIDDPFDERPTGYKPRTKAMSKIMEGMKSPKKEDLGIWMRLSKSATKAGDPNFIRWTISEGLLQLLRFASTQEPDPEFARKVFDQVCEDQKHPNGHRCYEEVRVEAIRLLQQWSQAVTA